MNRNTVVGLVGVGFLGVVIGFTLPAGLRAPEAQAQGPKKGPAWEYCTLSKLETADGVGVKSKFDYCFDTGEKGIEDRNWEELAKKMGVKNPKGGMNAIWDHLGSQGWELVGAYSAPNARADGGIFSVDEFWLFKRQRP
jgi:hypothetical protein